VDALGLRAEHRELSLGTDDELRVDVQEEDRFGGKAPRRIERMDPRESFERPLDLQGPGRRKDLRRGPNRAARVARPQEGFEPEGLSCAQIEDRLELDEDSAGAHHVEKPEGAHLEACGRKGRQVPDRVPFRLRGILGSDADFLGERTELRLQVR
jgi:hypothetical protein